MNTRTLLNTFVLCLSLALLNSCNNSSTRRGGSEPSIESRESHTHNEQEWVSLEYSNGTYGAEIGDEVILNNCENEIYMDGYDGDYVFKTQKGRDWQYYNLSGELLFTIPDADFAIVMSYLSDSKNTKCRNGYILVKDHEGKEGVYDLNGKMIISPQDCYYISPLTVKLENDTWALWGFKVDLRSKNSNVYTYDGKFVLSGENVVVESKCACPIFCVEKNDRYSLYNHKGERIINNTDYYLDYSIEYYDGCPYIVCETEYAADNYYEQDDMLWISMSGETLKEEGYTSIDYDIRSADRREYNDAKRELRNRMNQLPKFTAPYSSGSSATASGSHRYDGGKDSVGHYDPGYNYNPGYNNNQNDMGYQNPTASSSEDNSRWVTYYRDNYNRYANLVETHASTLRTLIATGDGGPTSSYAISNTRSSIRNAQREMTRLRNEAQQKGIYIDASPLESASF